MECDICDEEGRSEQHILCASCARSTVYMTRLDLARTLLDKENLERTVEASVTDRVDNVPSIDRPLAAAWLAEKNSARATKHCERTQETQTKITLLREELTTMRSEVERRKGEIAKRRANMETIQKQTRTRQLLALQKSNDVGLRGSSVLESIHHNSAEATSVLCREAAGLLGLKQKRKMKSGLLKEQYSIAGLLLPDLRDINNIRCVDLTAVLGHCAHLLVLVSFYLGIRLPAELTLPHRDYPLPTINTPSISYVSKKIAFPGSGSAVSIPGSPSASRQDIRSVPRPRPLFIGSDDRDEKVAQLAKRDPAAFSYFVEAIALLAWNISWLNRSQGFLEGTQNWEESCNMGRNLWRLIFSQQQSPAMLRALSNREVRPIQNDRDSGKSTASGPSAGKLGQLSHASAHSFLGAATINPARNWRLNLYTSIADPLKRTLLNEMNNAEWEFLQQDEWDDGGEQFDEAIFIKTRAMDGREYDDARSIMTTRTQLDDAQDIQVSDSGRAKGKRGWTKIKSRDTP